MQRRQQPDVALGSTLKGAKRFAGGHWRYAQLAPLQKQVGHNGAVPRPGRNNWRLLQASRKGPLASSFASVLKLDQLPVCLLVRFQFRPLQRARRSSSKAPPLVSVNQRKRSATEQRLAHAPNSIRLHDHCWAHHGEQCYFQAFARFA